MYQNNKAEDSSQQNNTGNMYSYHDEDNINNNNNDNNNTSNNQNQNNLQEAIRRSMNEINPYANANNNNYPPDTYNYQNSENNMNNNVQILQNQTYYNSLNKNNDKSFTQWVPYIIFAVIEIVIIILIGCLFEWDIRNDPKYSIINLIIAEEKKNESNKNLDIYEGIKKATDTEMKEYDGLFRDINVMVFVGFGIFHTLLKRFSWTSITINMMSIALSFQIGLFTNLLWANAFNEKWITGKLNFDSFIRSIINSASVLISSGCVFGKLNIFQYLILIILETIMCSLKFQLCDVKLKAIDGGALYIHTFGALFGLSIYMVMFYSSKMKSKNLGQDRFNKSDYTSNLASFMGVIFLWCYFPSFNSGLVTNVNARHRSSINTYLALTGSVLGAFAFSSLFYKGRILFEHILFGSFSGGVMISGCCSLCKDHWAALLIGLLSGSISVICLYYIKPYFIKWKYFDIYNIFYIHGLPGFLGAFITPMVIGNLKFRMGGEEYHFLLKDMERENNLQAGVQIGAIFITIGLAFVSGISTGYLMKVSTCGKIEKFFIDSEMFENRINVIDNVELNQFYYGNINRASLLQNRLDFPSERGSEPIYD